MIQQRPALVLLGRSYCHLCDDMLAALRQAFPDLPEVVTQDVDHDPELESRYGERVPVLLLDGQEVCHYHLDVGRLRQRLVARYGEFSEKPSAEC